MSEEAPINMQILRKKIIEGITCLQNPKNENASNQAVLFIGDTGVGKSTLLNYLIGNQLRVEEIGLKPCLVVQNKQQNQGQEQIKIGHEKYSETSIPVRVQFEGLAIYDCPGFNDNKGRQAEIANSFYYQRLLSLYQKTKIVLVIDESFLTECRAHRLPQLSKKLQTAFPLFQLKSSTLLLVNKCDADSTLDDVLHQMKKLLSTSLFTHEQVDFYQYLINNNRIYSFKQPKRSQIGQTIGNCGNGYGEREKLVEMVKDIGYMGKVEIKNIISDVAKLAIRDYLDIIIQKSGQNINKILQKLSSLLPPTSQNTNSRSSSSSTTSKKSSSPSTSPSSLSLHKLRHLIHQFYNCKSIVFSDWNYTPFFQLLSKLQLKVHDQELEKFKEELEIVEFFGKVYQRKKVQSYYMNVGSLIFNGLSVLLQKVQNLLEEEKLEVERKKRKQQRKLEQQKLQQLQNKQNKPPTPTPNPTPKKRPSNNETLASTSSSFKSQSFQPQPFHLEPLQSYSTNLTNSKHQNLVLGFHKKLLNTQLKIKQISYQMEDFVTKTQGNVKRYQQFGEKMDHNGNH